MPGFSYVDVNQWFNGDTPMSLTNYFNLNQICEGYHVTRVIAYVGTQPGYSAQASIDVNGYQVGYAQDVPQTSPQELDFYLDPNEDTIGYQVNDLTVRFQGYEYVQRVGLILE